MDPPDSACQFRVKMLRDAPITYSVPLKNVVNFALHGTTRGPQHILRKKRIRELLGMAESKEGSGSELGLCLNSRQVRVCRRILACA